MAHAPIPNFVQRIIELLKRYPGIIALGGFLSGIGSFILVDRQAGLASWIAIVMLVSWVWLMLENTSPSCSPAPSSGDPTALRVTRAQMIHQESLFFVCRSSSSPPPGTAASWSSPACSAPRG
jgi:hypothetical protein